MYCTVKTPLLQIPQGLESAHIGAANLLFFYMYAKPCCLVLAGFFSQRMKTGHHFGLRCIKQVNLGENIII